MKTTPYESNEWHITENDEVIATLLRGYPERYSNSGSSLYAKDKGKPCLWTLVVEEGESTSIPDGLTAAQAKKVAMTYLKARG